MSLAALSLFIALLVASTAVLADSSSGPDLGDQEELIVVTATKLPQPISEVPAPVAVVTAEEIRAAGAATLGEAVALAPGVAVVSQGGAGAVTSARLQGATSSQVQVLIDGRPADNGLAPVDLSLIPIADVERIEIVQGPVSSLYGANALGGVVNVITRRPENETEGRVEWEAGGFGARGLTLQVGSGAGEIKYLISGSSRGTDGWRKNSDSSAGALVATVSWPALAGEVTLQARQSRSEAGNPGSNGEFGTPSATPLARGGDEAGSLDATYRGSSPEDLTLRLYHSTEVITYDNPNSNPAYATHSRHQGWWNGLEAQRSLEIGSHQLVLGGTYRTDEAISANLSSRPSTSNLGLFVEDQFSPGGMWKFTLGGRFDSHSVYGQVFSPRLGAVRELGPDRRLWVSAGRAFRAPSLEDLYWLEQGEGWRVTGNPNLRPETSTAVQCGLTWGDLDLTLYHKDVQDNIDWVSWLGDDLIYYAEVENLAAARFNGLDLTYRRAFGANLKLEAGYSYLNAVNVETGLRLHHRPLHRGSLALASTLPGGWSGRAALKAVGPQFADKENRWEAPGFVRVDLTAVRELHAGVEWRIELENALNTSYQEVPGYPMPGASLTTAVSYRF